MAGGFFRKWFGGAPPVIPPEVEQALAEIYAVDVALVRSVLATWPAAAR